MLAQAREALAAGHLYLGLEEVGQVGSSLRRIESVTAARRAGPISPASFERAWGQARLELAVVDREVRGPAWSRAPLAIRGMAEAAAGETQPLLAASRAYAAVTSPGAGFFYLGEARAAAELTAFCRTLRAPQPASPLPLRSVFPELSRLQEQTRAAFQPPRSLRLHGRFIHLNATLKLAFELDAARLYAGAFYQYLDAAQQFGLLDPDSPRGETSADGARLTGLRNAIAEVRSRLSSSPADGSLAELFLERAAAGLGERGGPAAGAGAAPGVEARRRAAVIVEQVLPDYFAVLRPAAPPELPAQLAPQRPPASRARLAADTGKHLLTVTLLRWPYT